MLGLTRNTKEIELELVYKHSSFKFSLNDASLPIEPVKRKPMRIGIYIRIIASLCSLVFISFRKLIPEVSAVQYTFDRAFCSLILLALYFYFTKQYEIIKKTFEPKIAIISAGGCIADVLYFVAILSLPISEMVTIVSMVAIFNGIIGSYILGESYLRIKKILGAVSFLGVFLIVRPPFIFGSEGTAEDTPTGSIPRYFAGLIALGCAVVYSLIQVQLREIQARMPPFVVAFYFNLAYVILLGTYYVVTGSHEALNFHELTMIIGSSVGQSHSTCQISSIGKTNYCWACRIYESSVLSDDRLGCIWQFSVNLHCAWSYSDSWELRKALINEILIIDTIA